MAAAIDASTPIRASAAAAAVTSASFTPPAGSLLVAVTNSNSNGAVSATTVLSNTGTALTWTQRGIANFGSAGQNGATMIHTAPALAQATTVTTTTTNNNPGAFYVSLKVYVVTGVSTAGVGGSATGGTTTNAFTTTAFTTVGASSLGIAAGTDYSGAGLPTSSDMTADTFNSPSAGTLSGLSGYKTLSTAGSSATFNLDAFGTAAAAWTWVSLELLVSSTLPSPVQINQAIDRAANY